jgi:hypothetical protein|tara:strand:+ start:913 stop:1188 length:276 start_codon:yes stop_codon:yes gene_type:complete
MTELMKQQVRELFAQIEDCSDKAIALNAILNRTEFRGISAIMRLMCEYVNTGDMDDFIIHIAEFTRIRRKMQIGNAVPDLLEDAQNQRGVN